MATSTKTVASALAVLALPIVIGSALWFQDVHEDRQHTIIVNAPTPVFSGNAVSGACEGTQLTVVEKGTKLAVRRIRYFKDCAAVNVVLPDGRKGYLVLGVGDVSVTPPLPAT